MIKASTSGNKNLQSGKNSQLRQNGKSIVQHLPASKRTGENGSQYASYLNSSSNGCSTSFNEKKRNSLGDFRVGQTSGDSGTPRIVTDSPRLLNGSVA